MPKDDSPFSIFSSPSKKSTPKSAPVPDVTTTSSDAVLSAGKSAIDKNRETRRRVEEMRTRMDSLNSAIDEKIELLSRKRGLTKEQIWQFFSDSRNFSGEEWQVIEKKNKELTEEVWSIVNSDVVPSASPRNKSKETGPRKGKFIGARRNWIPTR